MPYIFKSNLGLDSVTWLKFLSKLLESNTFQKWVVRVLGSLPTLLNFNYKVAIQFLEASPKA